MRKMKSIRQIECVELMLTANNMTVAYAEALLAATSPHQLVGETKPRKMRGLGAEQMTKMAREMDNVQGRLKLVEKSCGHDVLIAVEAWSAHLARRYCPIWMNEVRNRGSFASRRAACCMFLMIIPSI